MMETCPCGTDGCGRAHLTEALMSQGAARTQHPALLKMLDAPLVGSSIMGTLSLESGRIIRKATKQISEMARMREVEDKLFRASLASYVEKANAAIKAGMSTFPKKGNRPVTRTQIVKALRKADNTFFRRWPPKSLQSLYDNAIDEVYRLAQQTVMRKAMGVKGYGGDRSLVYKAIATVQVKPSFTLVDEEAVAYLKGNQRYWVKAPGVWTKADSLIKQAAFGNIEGMLPEQAGQALEEAMIASYGTSAALAKSASYWEGVAVNAATTARVSGAIREMEAVGVTKYTITNPMDERTSKICEYMEGKTLTITTATTMLDKLMSASTPSATFCWLS